MYYFRSDKVCDSKIRAEKSSINFLKFIERKGENLLATLAEDGIIKLWLGNEIKEVIRIYDEEIKSDMGVEELHLTPKTFTY